MIEFGCEIVCSHAIVVLRPPPSQVDSPCLAWWDALDGLTVVLRWRMSCVGAVTAWRPPALVRPTPGASSHQLCEHHARASDECLRFATRSTGS